MTTIYVTHDQVEAMTMGDRVAVMRKGDLQQVAPPQELYERPVNLFVGGFIGSPAMNLVEAEIRRSNGRLSVHVGEHSLALSDELMAYRPKLEAYVDKRLIVGIRPENLEDAALEPDMPDDQRLRGVVVLREPLGSEIVAHFTVDAPPRSPRTYASSHGTLARRAPFGPPRRARTRRSWSVASVLARASGAATRSMSPSRRARCTSSTSRQVSASIHTPETAGRPTESTEREGDNG